MMTLTISYGDPTLQKWLMTVRPSSSRLSTKDSTLATDLILSRTTRRISHSPLTRATMMREAILLTTTTHSMTTTLITIMDNLTMVSHTTATGKKSEENIENHAWKRQGTLSANQRMLRLLISKN